MKVKKFKNKKEIFYNKIYNCFRKKSELKTGIRYNNFRGVKKAVDNLDKFKKFFSKSDFEQLITNDDLSFDELKLIDFFNKILLKAVNNKKNKIAANVCCYIGNIYSFLSDKKAAAYYKRAVDFDINCFEAYIFCGLIYIRCGKYEEAEKQLEHIFDKKFKFSILHIKSFVNFKENQKLNALAYSGLADIALNRGDLREASIKLFMALRVFEKNNMISDIADTYQKLGVMYRIVGNADQAEEMHKAALKCYQEISWQECIADSYGNLGMTMGVREDFESALDYHIKSLKINKKIKRIAAIASQYENIGLIYHMSNNLTFAKRNFKKALDLFIKNDSKEAAARNYENLSVLYEKNKNIKKALKCSLKALDIYQNMSNIKGQAECHANIGRQFHKISNFKSSISHFNNAINIEKELGINKSLSMSLNNLGLLYIEKEQFSLAEKSLKEALNLELKTRRLVSIGTVYKNLSYLENLKNNDTKSLEYEKKAQSYLSEI